MTAWLLTGQAAAAPGDPPGTRAQASTAATTSAPLKVEIEAELDGAPVSLSGDFVASSAGVCLTGPGGTAGMRSSCPPPGRRTRGQPVECRIGILSLTQFGTVSEPEPWDWLFRLAADGETSVGRLSAEWSAAGLVYPARLTLALDLAFTVRRLGGSPVELRSRQALRLEGTIQGWPPYTESWPPRSVVLRLVDPPVAFYRTTDPARSGDDRPLLVVDRVTAVLGTQPTGFFVHRPDLRAGRPVRGEGGEPGIELRWSPTRESVSVPAITVYSVYRRGTEEGAAWRLAARVPADRTSVVDSGFRGGAPVTYVVRHGTELPFGHVLEGLPGRALTVDPGDAIGAAGE
jgi:hypothetical protein